MAGRATTGAHRALVLTADVPARVGRGGTGVARFLIRNVGDDRWMAAQHDRKAAQGIGVVFDGRLSEVVPLRNTVTPAEVSPLAFEFGVPIAAGEHTVEFCLMPLRARRVDSSATVFHGARLTIESEGPTTPNRLGLLRRIRRIVGRQVRRTRGRFHAASLPTRAQGPAYGARYVEHSIPMHPAAGVVYGVRLTVVNTGSLTWQARPGDGHPVKIDVSVDDTPLISIDLPGEAVGPGEEATVHFPFRAPDTPGVHRVAVDLVHAGITRFSDQHVSPWPIDITVVDVPPTPTTRLFELQRKHNPWRYDPFCGVARSRDGHPFPLVVADARGCRVWDLEGHEFLDYQMGSGSTILGHADERIQEPVRRMLGMGSIPPFVHPVELELSRLLIEQFPWYDMVTFGKNGSDVCTIAARLARVVTKKKVILSCGFHGWQDFGLEYFRFEDCGIPYRDDRSLFKFRFNDLKGFFELYERHRHDLAAVMIEPAGPLIDDESGLGGEADTAFLQALADAAREVGALLVFDEIITGFRYRQGSVQKATGVIPDITCLGKALASGMPLSAILMPYRHCLEHFHKTHFHPTFRHEVYSLAAAHAAVQIYKSEPVAERIWQYGDKLRRGIHDVCRTLGVEGGLSGPPFRMQFIFREPDAARRRLKRSLLLQELFKQRIITFHCMLLVSAAHDERAHAQTIDGFAQALEVVLEADRRGELHRRLELFAN
jgi:glutamate-1-semialdehyde aminotransferase